jgi:hypothetical protein
MYCIRCRGVMAAEHFFDFEGIHEFMWMKGWRCMNCGHADNPLVEADRRLREAALFPVLSEEQEDEHRHLYLRAEHVRELPCEEGRGVTPTLAEKAYSAPAHWRISRHGHNSRYRR